MEDYGCCNAVGFSSSIQRSQNNNNPTSNNRVTGLLNRFGTNNSISEVSKNQASSQASSVLSRFFMMFSGH